MADIAKGEYMTFEIRSEDDLFQAIALLEGGEWPDGQIIRFVDWPRYEITIRGEDFDGGVPTRIMPALLKLQSAVNRAYARSIYGTVRRLTQHERKKTELIVRLKPGSTTFQADITEILNAIITEVAGNMSGPETVTAVLGTAFILAGASVWKTYINAAAKKRDIDYRTRVSEEETKRYQIIGNIAERHSAVTEHLADTNAAQRKLLKSLDRSDRLLVGGEEIVSGELAKLIVRKEREIRVEDRLDGDYVILSVESGRIHNGFRVRVQDVVSGDDLQIWIPEGTLPSEQIADLQSGEWKKEPLHMQINIERVGERIIKATLISAGLSRT